MKPYFAALLAIIPAAGNAFALTSGEDLAEAKVPPAQARKLAAKVLPGKIVSEELEREAGGSGLRYSYVIQYGNTKHEVGIDAKTGKLLENSIEGGDPD